MAERDFETRISCFDFSHIAQYGYWLYVWTIIDPKGVKFLYVGATGDTGSTVANSALNRITNQWNVARSALRENLERLGVKLDDCTNVRVVCHGPLFKAPKEGDDEYHTARRRRVAPLEGGLARALRANDYCVMGQHPTLKGLCISCWQEVRAAFSDHFCLGLDIPGIGRRRDDPCDRHR